MTMAVVTWAVAAATVMAKARAGVRALAVTLVAAGSGGHT